VLLELSTNIQIITIFTDIVDKTSRRQQSFIVFLFFSLQQPSLFLESCLNISKT
jgi:hypothetical protein